MAQGLDNDLLDLWLRARELQVGQIRELIEHIQTLRDGHYSKSVWPRNASGQLVSMLKHTISTKAAGPSHAD